MDPHSIQSPHFHLLAGDLTDVDEFVATLRYEGGPGLAVRVLRGGNMQSTDGFYNEISAAVQFPLYFGRNFAALDECLADLEWLPAEAYTLVLFESPSILKLSEDGAAEAFFKLLARISDEWAAASSPDAVTERKPTPFHVVFHSGTAEAAEMIRRMERATGDKVSRLTIDPRK